MRSLVLPTVLVALSMIAVPAFASSPDDKPFDQNTIAALEQRISQAHPREQCFLYAELIHEMTEFSLNQYAAGDVAKAGGLFSEGQQITHKKHLTSTYTCRRGQTSSIH